MNIKALKNKMMISGRIFEHRDDKIYYIVYYKNNEFLCEEKDIKKIFMET